MRRLGLIGCFLMLGFYSQASGAAPGAPLNLTTASAPTTVTFGPVSSIVTYPGTISTLAQDEVRWEITFTLNSLPPGTSKYGLASRDQYGTVESGHLSIWVNATGNVVVRHQHETLPNIELLSTTQVEVGTEYLAIVSVSVAEGLGLFVGDTLEASNDAAYGLSGNTLPLVLGGTCIRCTRDGVDGGDDAPADEIDGTVYMEIVDSPLPIPEPITGSVILEWTLPVEYEDDSPIEPGSITQVSIYEAATHYHVATLDGEATVYEVADLPEGEHCFVATVWADTAQSYDSNVVCGSIP